MTHTIDDLDRELELLNDLAKDYSHDSFRWNLLWEHIDRLLEERATITKEEE